MLPTRDVRSRIALFIVALVLPTALVVSCATNPATGKREFSLVSPDQEIAIGREGYAATIAEYGLYDDPRITAYVDSIGQRLAKSSELPTLQWHFTVLDDPVVNAFAMPGGYIYLTRGILSHLGSEAQLAGVMGHEIGHVTARHSARQITQQQIAGLGLGLAGVFSESFRQYSGAAQQALGLLLLKYSRDDENTADELGVRYTTAAGWDPREIPNTYVTLQRISEQAGSRLPGFLSTHPDPGDRQQRTTTLSAAAAAGKTGLAVRERVYLEHLRGMVFGEDPRQGYFESDRYYHPGMGFELAFPAGWATQNGRSAVIAQEPAKQGGMQMTLAANARSLGPAEYVAALQRDGRISAAEGRSESIGGYSAWVGRVSVPDGQGGTKVFVAAFIRQAPDRLLQFIAQVATADLESRVVASVRTLRPLQDPRRASPTPARLRVSQAPSAGPFTAVYPMLGPVGLDVKLAAIMNGMDEQDGVASGQWLKSVEPVRRR
ncbi:MAG: M48 family metalloprotease [Candidatus Eisenbacteria bacterium]